mgnify:CR=1 FL=1
MEDIKSDFEKFVHDFPLEMVPFQKEAPASIVQKNRETAFGAPPKEVPKPPEKKDSAIG